MALVALPLGDLEGTEATGSVGYQFYQSENSSAFVALGVARLYLEADVNGRHTFRDGAGNIVQNVPGTWEPFGDSESANDVGALISAGYRSNLSDTFQLGLRFDLLQTDESSARTSAEVLYKLSDALVLQVNASVAEGEIKYGFGTRFRF